MVQASAGKTLGKARRHLDYDARVLSVSGKILVILNNKAVISELWQDHCNLRLILRQ